MENNDRDFIHGVAQQERAIRALEEGDHVTVQTAEWMFAGVVKKVHASDISESHVNEGIGNFTVVVENELDGKLPGAFNHYDVFTVAIDYEGAFESDYDYYVPYVVASADMRGLGDVQQLDVEKDAADKVNA